MSKSLPKNLFDKEESDVLINFKRLSSVKEQESGVTINSNKFSETNKIDINEEKENQQNQYILCKVCELESSIEESFHLICKHTFCKECWYFYLDQKINL
jgi:hypothetical protein